MIGQRKGLVAVLLTALLLGNLPALLGTSIASPGRIDTAEAAVLSPACTRTATINVSVTTSSGGSIGVTGSGFLAFEPVTLYFNAAVPFGGTDQGSNPVSSPTTVVDTNGNLTASLPVGSSPVANSRYSITAVGSGGSCATFTGLRVPVSSAGVTGSDVLTVSSISQTVIVTSSIIPNTASQNVAATIDTASANNYYKTQATPMAVPVLLRPDLSTATYSAFQVTVPGALSLNVHSLVINATVPGSSTYSDAVGVRYQQISPASLTVSPTSGVASSSMTLSGAGFTGATAGTAPPITITLSGAGQVLTPTNTSPVQTSISGTFSTTFSVPNLGNGVGGTAIITATDDAGTAATTTFTVQPLSAITNTASVTAVPLGGTACTPTGGATFGATPNQPLVIVLSGFGPNESVPVVIGGITAGSLTTDQNGAANGTLPFPNLSGSAGSTPANGLPTDKGVAPSAYLLSAVGATSGRVGTQSVASCATTLGATSPNVAPGTAQTITGTGFATGEVVTVTSYPTSASQTLTTSAALAFTATASPIGQITGVYTAPTSFTTSTLRAVGTSGLVATTSVTTTITTITSLATAVTPCSTFAIVVSSGFTPGAIVTITPQGGSPVTATVTSSGGFVATLTAPSNAPVSGLPITIASSLGNAIVTQAVTVPTASLSVNPTSLASGASTLVSGAGFIPLAAVTVSTNLQSNGQAVPAGGQQVVTSASSSGTFTATLTISPTLLTVGGTYQVTATSACSAQNMASTPITVTGLATGGQGIGGTSTTYYFAEGYTGRATTNGRADFNESISVLNPDNVAKTITFTYQIQGQTAPVVVTSQLAPNSDIVRSVNADVGNDRIVSAIVSADGGIVAQRQIDRITPNGSLDSSTSLGATAPSTTWDFAEGYTGISFQEYLTVLNPNAAPANITVTFLPQSATTSTKPLSETMTVLPNGRATENIRSDYLKFHGNPNKSVGMLITSDLPIVAERVMYWGDGSGSAKFGADDAMGLANPGTQFFFAYGSDTGPNAANATSSAQMANDESYVTIVNANPTTGSAATVLVSFFNSSGQPIGSKTVSVAPQTRQTVVVTSVITAVQGPYYTQITSDQPIFVERPQYIGGSPNIGKHPGFAPAGVPGATSSILFPSLNTASGSGSAIQQHVFLLNTGNATITVTGVYYTPGSQTASVPYTVPAHHILVVNVNADTQGLPTGPVGAQFSATGGQFVATSVSNTPDGLAYWASQGVAWQ